METLQVFYKNYNVERTTLLIIGQKDTAYLLRQKRRFKVIKPCQRVHTMQH